MKRQLATLIPTLLLLAACSGDSPAPAANGTEPAASPDTTSSPAAATTPDTDNAPSAVTQAKDNLVPGVDYVEIPGGQPLQPLDGKIEVVEAFAYWCGHCNAFEPLVQAWKAKLPEDVRFTVIPLGDDKDTTARIFYAAQTSQQLDKVHPAMFHALHAERAFAPNASQQEMLSYLGKKGVNTQSLEVAMNSFSINNSLAQGLRFAQRSGIEGTPTLVVNGKYRITRGMEEALQVANALIAREREAGKSAAPAPAAVQ